MEVATKVCVPGTSKNSMQNSWLIIHLMQFELELVFLHVLAAMSNYAMTTDDYRWLFHICTVFSQFLCVFIFALHFLLVFHISHVEGKKNQFYFHFQPQWFRDIQFELQSFRVDYYLYYCCWPLIIRWKSVWNNWNCIKL